MIMHNLTGLFLCIFPRAWFLRVFFRPRLFFCYHVSGSLSPAAVPDLSRPACYDHSGVRPPSFFVLVFADQGKVTFADCDTNEIYLKTIRLAGKQLANINNSLFGVAAADHTGRGFSDIFRPSFLFLVRIIPIKYTKIYTLFEKCIK